MTKYTYLYSMIDHNRNNRKFVNIYPKQLNIDEPFGSPPPNEYLLH